MGIFLLVWFICLIAGTIAAGDRKIGTGLGFLVCFLLGFIGLIIVLCSPKIRDSNGDLIEAQPIKVVEPIPNAPNVDDLLKYASLLDKGLITKEEFDLQKAKLMK